MMYIIPKVRLLVRLLLLLSLLLLSACGSAPHDLVSSVPLGTKLSDLDRYLKRGGGNPGEVTEWTPATKIPQEPDHVLSNEFGVFTVKKLASYDDWKASTQDLNAFTGEVTFTDFGSTSADVNTFIFIRGVLRKKDWGFLPG